ncbi:Protein CBG26510 [Caenorhabditis briggsae]|uniref:Protein CBG26510 n=1 Tax=Caenorhabditis briggsae TaxID=6238 RepID=B6IG33_CAEBR|nr:Protein CBG26510 [Caenorhabditis briggsae]CAR98863.1 Protein CBG26510 [Caenorhabditis briggsae]
MRRRREDEGEEARRRRREEPSSVLSILGSCSRKMILCCCWPLGKDRLSPILLLLAIHWPKIVQKSVKTEQILTF